MALTLLFIGAAVVTGSAGITTTVKAGTDAYKANKINQSAQELIDHSKETLESQRKACADSLTHLGEEKLFVLNHSITEFLDTFTKIKNVDFRETEGLLELKNFHIDQKEFEELEEMASIAGSFVKGTATGVAGGAAVAFGAYGAAQTFAAASTGTAIATLHGAAATNATLAFFGGGSLASGGLGMAGGTMVLGGLVAGPALLALGLITSHTAKKNLEQAYTNREEAEQIYEQLNALSLQCEAIRRRTYSYYSLLAKTDSYFLPLIYQMEDIVKNEGDDYRLYNTESKKVIASCASFAVTIKSILDTPLLDVDGNLTEESKKMIGNVKEKLREMN